MLITYDTQQYPTVFVKIVNGIDEDNTLYESFMTFFEDQYKKKKHFHMFFDVIELTRPDLRIMSDYIKRIKQLKEYEIQYLDYYLIVNQNAWVSKLLYMLWKVSHPLATVYLIVDKQVALTLLKDLKEPMCNQQYIDVFVIMNDIAKVEIDRNINR